MNSLREAIQGMRRARYMSLVSVMTITIALVILGLAGIATLFANGVLNGIRHNEEVNIYIKENVSDSEMLALDESISSMNGVESTRIIGKEEAAADFENMFGKGFLSALDENPLPRTIAVKISGDKLKAMNFENFIKNVKSASGVESVEYGREWVSKLDMLFLIFVLVEIAIAAIISIAGILVISNTITLTIIARKDAIDIMRLVGATEGFIRRPFYYEGLLQGMLSGIIAFSFFIVIYFWISSTFPGLESYMYMMRIEKLSALTLPFIIGLIIPAGTLLGFLGSLVAIKRIC
jgi:cell division transport system permease protein